MEMEPEEIKELNESKLESKHSIQSSQNRKISLTSQKSVSKQQISVNPQNTTSEVKSKQSKFGVDKVMSNLKERIACLEK